jgi:hypothetical protein
MATTMKFSQPQGKYVGKATIKKIFSISASVLERCPSHRVPGIKDPTKTQNKYNVQEVLFFLRREHILTKKKHGCLGSVFRDRSSMFTAKLAS